MTGTPRSLAELTSASLELPEIDFTDGSHLYTTSGRRVGHGGMGSVWRVERRPLDAPEAPPEILVAKTFREEYLALLKEDRQAKRRFDHFSRVLVELHAIDHPNVLPMLFMAPIADNYILVSPLAGTSILTLVNQRPLSAHARLALFVDGLRGLAALHEHGIVHRDFTLNNVLERAGGAAVFDFDLSVIPMLLSPEERSYAAYYQGRIVGSPEFSVGPELLDEALAEGQVSPAIDTYSAGTALYALFTEQSIYGEVPDLVSLLYRIADGIAHRDSSQIIFPPNLPEVLYPIVQKCLQREPEQRYADAHELLAAVEEVLPQLPYEEVHSVVRKPLQFAYTDAVAGQDGGTPTGGRRHPEVSAAEFERMQATIGRHGYLIDAALGRVKGHAIYLARPDPELVSTGHFPEENLYPKIITAIESATQPPEFLANWLGRIHPILMRARQGYLTTLYKVFHERSAGQLLLFSEYVDDARFGGDLVSQQLGLEEALGLGLIVALTISRLHEHGLAHNNVRLESLLFRGQRDLGRVQSLFVGLVEPSFAPEALLADVQNLAGMIHGWIRPARLDALRPTVRPVLERLHTRLVKIAAAEVRIPTMQSLVHLVADGLAAIEPNFDLVRVHGGNIFAYADMLVRHSLFNRLYAVDVASLT